MRLADRGKRRGARARQMAEWSGGTRPSYETVARDRIDVERARERPMGVAIIRGGNGWGRVLTIARMFDGANVIVSSCRADFQAKVSSTYTAANSSATAATSAVIAARLALPVAVETPLSN
jgi:hypothetical protein